MVLSLAVFILMAFRMSQGTDLMEDLLDPRLP
jgi:hypothetical protein